jgi:hypothetical protein
MLLRRSLTLENNSKLDQNVNNILYSVGKKQFITYICKSLNLKPKQIDKNE